MPRVVSASRVKVGSSLPKKRNDSPAEPPTMPSESAVAIADWPTVKRAASGATSASPLAWNFGSTRWSSRCATVSTKSR